MRLKVEIDDLTQDQWEQANRILQTSYDIPDGASRACLVVIHGNEDRHVETPVIVLTGLLFSLNLVQAFRQLADAVTKIRAMAALTPDDDRLPGEPCEHGSAVITADPSAFDGAPAVRTHEDGCQSYGPYATGSDA